MKQLTLKEPFTVKGKGLHSGLDIEATFCPAPDNHGYKFQRVDLDGAPTVDALAEYVSTTRRGTVLTQNEVSVGTIEHAMSALYASGIDNVLIKINAPEMPILDGSARPFIEEIERVGIVEQKADKDFYIVKRKIEVCDKETGSSIVVLPDEELTLDVKVNFDSPVLANQYATLDRIEEFNTEIAPSRTFVFVREIEPLLKGGLIKGGDLANALVIYDSPMNQETIDHIADLMGVPHKSGQRTV